MTSVEFCSKIFVIGERFMFSANHFIWLALTVLLIAGLTFCSVKFKFSFKTVMLTAVIICIICIIERIATGIILDDINGDPSYGYVVDQSEIPLHLCSIMIFAYVALLFLKDGQAKEIIKSFVSVVGLMGAVCACLIPTQGVSFANPNAYEYFIYHGTLIWIGLHLLITKQANLKVSAYWKNLVTLGALVLVILFVDSALSVYHVNYFFLVRPPMDNLPVLNLDHGWHVYFLTIAGLMVLAITLFHLPSMIKEAVLKKKQKVAETEPPVQEENEKIEEEK